MFRFFGARRTVENLEEFDRHKEVTFHYDEATGLRGFIAIYSDARGPALGATRLWPYKDDLLALRSALNLSKTMAYKSALAGLPYGGGKAVLVGDPKKIKSKPLLEEYARRVHSMGGRFRTGTDVGLTDDDVRYMKKFTPYMIGVHDKGKTSPSEMAALSAYYTIQACFEEVNMETNLVGKKVAIKGLGKTGTALARFLMDAGLEVVGADIDMTVVAAAKKAMPRLRIVPPTVIHREAVDVFAPCALGGDLSNSIINELHCTFIAGTENNQLQNGEVGDLLHRLGIVYAPDYIANAGGLIDVVDEMEEGGYKIARVHERVKAIKKTIRKIIARSMQEKRPTHRIADEMAEEILNKPNKKSNR